MIVQSFILFQYLNKCRLKTACKLQQFLSYINSVQNFIVFKKWVSKCICHWIICFTHDLASFCVHLSIDFSHTSLLLLFCTWAYCSYGVMWFFYRLWSCYRIMKLEWTSWRGHCRTSLKGDYSSGDTETGWFVTLTSGYTIIQVSRMDGNANELYQYCNLLD